MTPLRKVEKLGSYRLKKEKAKGKKRRTEKKQQGEDKQKGKKGKRKARRPILVAMKTSSRKRNYRSRYVTILVPRYCTVYKDEQCCGSRTF
jgi:hypothetical protein